MLKRVLSVVMVSMLALGNSSFAQADEDTVQDLVTVQDVVTVHDVVTVQDVDQDAEEDEADEIEADADGDDENGKGKVWKGAKNLLGAEKDALEEAKDDLEKRLEELEKQYEEAVESRNVEAVALMEGEIAALKAEFAKAKADFKAKLAEMKAAIRAEYTKEEMDGIAKVTEELEAQGMDVLPVENVISKVGKFKFDVPPVIKEGRTLIPVRAILEGFGANVEWDAATKTVTITKDGTTIVLMLEEKTATVNGQSISLDIPVEIMNNRTVVPLRFIAESMGLTVEWDADDSVIEIEE
ncbi:MAG: hypothetical protein GT589_04995 [Peptoclostridium sp.]|uniref:copper amine oxidase N-terminal domain-containing protein n=1 Tax=Peptoclostridium sp. TaxID=1904860 RepID=UPI00139E5F93|nr:copper amine oxidase N-terminal domain-containing protein [Peptoclostridium sp.]MZQ75500.1 hypothetical protein [Peptoclostridium sp.]